MNINIYLPDEIAERAKSEGLPLSRMLRDAVSEEIERRDAMTTAQDGMVQEVVDNVDRHGNKTRLRFTGKMVEQGDSLDVYLTEAGAVLVVFEEEGYVKLDDVEAFGEWVGSSERNNQGGGNEQALRVAAAELGLPEVIDID